MSNRLIRDGLLESEAVLSLPVEARWLYVSILLSADDVGLFDATPFRLARRADVRREMADKLVQMLSDADLIRLYEVGGKRYGFIPKYKQRLQLRRHKHPAPPMALLQGDSDAINKIKDLASKSSVNNGDSRIGNRSSPPESESEAKVIQAEPTALAQAPVGKRDLTPDEIIFGYGVPLLVQAGNADKAARSFLGKLRKVHGDETVINTLRQCMRAKPLQPLEWLAKALPPKQAMPSEAAEAARRDAENAKAAALLGFDNGDVIDA